MKKAMALVLCLMIMLASAFSLAEEPTAAKLEGSKIQRLTDEPVTLTCWVPVDRNAAYGKMIQDLNEMDLMKTMEEKTGVHIEFEVAPIGQEESSFSLMLASRKYPDIIIQFGMYYTLGAENAIDEGILLDLNDLIEQYAPNYHAARTSSELRMKGTLTDKGYQPYICAFSYKDIPGLPSGGAIIRKDLLNKLGMEIPVTYDDWYTFLSRCTNELGLKRTFGMNYAGICKYNAFNAGFGFGMMSNTVSAPFYQIDGKVMYAPLTDNYREYLEMMAKWYAEGLIDPDFTSTLTFDDGVAMMSSGESAGTADHGALLDYVNTLGKAVDPDFEYIAVPDPVKNEGDPIHIYSPTGNGIDRVFAISTTCKNPELAVAWCDQFFTDEGFMLCNYGTLDKTYTIVDGEPVYTDLIWENPQGSITDMLSVYAGPAQWPAFERVTGRDTNEAAKANFRVWQSNADNLYEVPSDISLNTEEMEAYSSVFPEIKSYVEEMTVKFIMGLEPMENYDRFVQQIKDLDIDTAINAYQTALDRYLSR